MTSQTAFKPVRLLLIEDNPGDVRLTQEAFKTTRLPITLDVATDGEEALELLHARGRFKNAPRPDLILLDLNLPRKTGSEVLSDVKNDPELKRIPVLVMTTSRAEADVEHCYNLNANCFITKPLAFDEFVDVVKSIEDFWLMKASLPSE